MTTFFIHKKQTRIYFNTNVITNNWIRTMQHMKYAKYFLLNKYECFIILVWTNCFRSEKNATVVFIAIRRVMEWRTSQHKNALIFTYINWFVGAMSGILESFACLCCIHWEFKFISQYKNDWKDSVQCLMAHGEALKIKLALGNFPKR